MDEIDIAVIGAGVVGLAVAKEVAKDETTVAVLERNKSFGQETSSRNSEVIHAGMHYPSGTLKAELCVEGRKLLYEICDKFKIPHKKTGKFIIATDRKEAEALDKLFEQGKNKGVTGIKMVDQEELNEMEPNIQGVAALYSSETGIIDSHRLMQYFLDSARDNGAMVAFNCEVIGIEKIPHGYKLSIKNNNDLFTLKTLIVVNCAGLDSDVIAQMAGIDIRQAKYELHYCKGQYFRVKASKSGLLKRLVYPVPEVKSAGLGIHATVDLGGSLRLGPDDEYLRSRERDYSVDHGKRFAFYSSVKKFMPFLEEEDLSADISGIRPKLQGPGEDFRDFIIQEESARGLPGFINTIGIESPGLTASPAIARYVKELIKR